MVQEIPSTVLLSLSGPYHRYYWTIEALQPQFGVPRFGIVFLVQLIVAVHFAQPFIALKRDPSFPKHIFISGPLCASPRSDVSSAEVIEYRIISFLDFRFLRIPQHAEAIASVSSPQSRISEKKLVFHFHFYVHVHLSGDSPV